MFFEYGDILATEVDRYYPMVCTCTEAFEQQKERAGYDQSTIEIFETCSEKLALSNYFDDHFDDYLATYDKEYTDREEYDDQDAGEREQPRVRLPERAQQPPEGEQRELARRLEGKVAVVVSQRHACLEAVLPLHARRMRRLRRRTLLAALPAAAPAGDAERAAHRAEVIERYVT